MVSKIAAIGTPSAFALSRSTSMRYCGTSVLNVVDTPASSGRLPAASITRWAAPATAGPAAAGAVLQVDSKPPVVLMPGIGGGLNAITTPSLKPAFSAMKVGGRLRASMFGVGPLRPVLQRDERNAGVGLLRAGQESRSRPKVTTSATAGFFIDGASVTSSVTARCAQRRRRRQRRHQEDVALVLVRHEAPGTRWNSTPGGAEITADDRQADQRRGAGRTRRAP